VSSLFINSGILGHGTLFETLQEVTPLIPGLDAHHVHLGKSIETVDRVFRKLVSPRLPGLGAGSNTDFIRFRAELNMGMMAERQIRKFERNHKLNLLHLHPQPTAYCSISRLKRTPSIVSIDATQELMRVEAPTNFQKWTYKPNIAWDRKVFAAAGAIVSTSAWAARDLMQNYPESAHKVNVIPYPVQLRWFLESWPAERSARAGRVSFLFVGNDFRRKGGFTLLEAWSELKLPNAVLRIVTGDQLSDLPPGVELVRGIKQYTPEWQQVWREADVFVLPTRAEAFGIVFQEAAAAGIPAIGTRLNAIPEIVLDSETGLLVPPDDSRSLAQAIARLAASRDLRLSLGVRARSRMFEIGSASAYAKKLSAVVEKVSNLVPAR
jgi:glycosyltransferase involved in cell wall biosynthesis